MFPVVTLSGHAHFRADRVRRVNAHASKPMYIDTRNCALTSPTFTTRSSLTLANGMVFYTDQPYQELQSAVAEATHTIAVPMMPVVISDHIIIDPAHIIAVLPYNWQLCNSAEEHGYAVERLCENPGCLIIMDDGDTCLAIEDAPAELMDKLSNSRQA